MVALYVKYNPVLALFCEQNIPILAFFSQRYMCVCLPRTVVFLSFLVVSFSWPLWPFLGPSVPFFLALVSSLFLVALYVLVCIRCACRSVWEYVCA